MFNFVAQKVETSRSVSDPWNLGEEALVTESDRKLFTSVQSISVSASGQLCVQALIELLNAELHPTNKDSLVSLQTSWVDLWPEHETHLKVKDKVICLLDQWLADESGYDEETWTNIEEALDKDRLSARKLFDDHK